MQLTDKEVQKVAKLANLNVTEKEEQVYAKQLSAVLDYIGLLNKVDTTGVDPTYNTSVMVDVEAEDERFDGLTQDEALKNAPNKKQGFFVTKGVFESE